MSHRSKRVFYHCSLIFECFYVGVSAVYLTLCLFIVTYKWPVQQTHQCETAELTESKVECTNMTVGWVSDSNMAGHFLGPTLFNKKTFQKTNQKNVRLQMSFQKKVHTDTTPHTQNPHTETTKHQPHRHHTHNHTNERPTRTTQNKHF